MRRIAGVSAWFAFAVSLSAQTANPSIQVLNRVDDRARVTLRGNTHPLATAEHDRGRVHADLPMTDLILVLRRSPEQQQAFDRLVESQYDPASPEFHHWLKPSEVGERFGPAPSDIDAVSNWLRGHGFSIDEVTKDRTSIRFSGYAAQVEDAFQTEIHNLEVNGEQHIANMTDPRIPAALSQAVVGVKALHNFFPKPQYQLGSQVALNRKTGKWERLPSGSSRNSAASGSAEPEMAGPAYAKSGGKVEDVTPYDFAAIYNVLPLWNAATPIDGTGQTIAIAGTSNINLADIAAFRSTFGLPPSIPQVIIANGTDPGLNSAQIENTLDVEWSGAVAKGAKIILVTSGANSSTSDTLFNSASYIVNQAIAPIMSFSYADCELDLGTAGNAEYNNLWSAAQIEGISVFVASGDWGSATCDAGGDSGGTPYAAHYGLSVNGMASTPYNTAVGGTDFNWGSTPAPYWTTSSNPSTKASALGYIPEVPLNLTCTNPLVLPLLAGDAANYGYPVAVTDAELACNFVFTKHTSYYQKYGVNLSKYVDTLGGGGGMSLCTVNNGMPNVSTCSGGNPKPSWQTGVTGIPNDGRRDVPDVSFFSSNGFLGSAYIICVATTGACNYAEVGGTSVSAPAMAGVMALINQDARGTVGNPNRYLYQLAAQQTYSSCSTESGTVSNLCYFNDVDTGSIAMPCVYGTGACAENHAGDSLGILAGFPATRGFDLATGLGSLNVANVVNNLPLANRPKVSLSSSVDGEPYGTSITFQASLAGNGASPTGTVTFLDGATQIGAAALNSGMATFTTSALHAGTHSITVNYPGNIAYINATATISVEVTQANPTVTWATPAAITYGTTLSATQLNAAANVPGTFAYTPASGALLTAGSHNLTVTFTPTDLLDYTTASATVVQLVNQATPQITWANPAAITYGATLSGTQLNAAASVPGAFVYTPASGALLTAGQHTLSVAFTPTDTLDYTNASTTATIQVNQATPQITWATPAAITYGTTLSATQLNATTPVPGAFVYTPASGALLTAGQHALSVAFTPTDTLDYTNASATVTLQVNQATPQISWANPAAITYGTTLSAAQLNATASVPGIFTYTPASGALLTAGQHTLSVAFTPTDTLDYTSAAATVTQQVNQATPQITWANPAAITYGTTLSGTQLNAVASVPGAFVYTPASGALLTAGQHTLSVAFTPTDTLDYTNASATVTIQVNQATPQIAWANPAAITYGTTLSGTQLNASASVSGAYVYNPASGVLLTAGLHTLSVTFTPTDTLDYTNASATVTLQVNQATPQITWINPAAITYGTTLSATQLNAAASVPGALVYNPASGALLTAGQHTLLVAFTPTDTLDYTNASATVTLQVNQATPQITWANPAAITYGTTLSGVQLNAAASVPGTFVYNPASGSLLTAGQHTLTATFAPSDALDYTNASASVTIQVNQATPQITWANPAAITYGTTLSGVQLNAAASVPGTFVYNPASGALLTAGQHTLAANFTPSDTLDYTNASATATLQVNQATPQITWANPAAITYGMTLSGAQLNATASVPGAFVYNPASGSLLTAGQHTLSVTFTPADTLDYTSVSATVTQQVNQATPSIAWPAPAAITYGDRLSSTQLNATSPVQGTFLYTPASGALLTAGPHTLSVNFTPADTLDYTNVTVTTTIQVIQATPQITWGTPAAMTYGTMLSAAQLNAASPVGGTFVYTPASGTTLTAGSHTLSVTFTPTDVLDYTGVTATVTQQVNQAMPLVVWPTPAAITYGAELSSTQLDATSTVPGSYSYSPLRGTVLTAGSHTISVTFTPNDTTDYTNSAASVTLVVNPAAPVIQWPTPEAISVCTIPGAPMFNATATAAGVALSGTFAYSPAPGTPLNAGLHTLSVTFRPADALDYTAATGSVKLLVNQATPSIIWSEPASLAYGTALSSIQLDATETTCGTSIGGAFVYTPAAGTVLTGGSHTLSVTFKPTDTTDYTPATATVTQQVNQVTPAITWATPATIPYGTMLSAAQLNATSNVQGTFTYTPAAGAVPSAGSHTLSVTFQPADTTDYTTATATRTLQVARATPRINWPAPSSITYGAALSSAQLNATSATAGVFTYSPAAGAIPGAGSHTLTVSFTPADTTNFSPTTATVTLQVNKAVLTVTANNANRAYGAANPAFTAAISGFVNGDTASRALTGSASVTTSATVKSFVGSYAITPATGSLSAANYTFRFVNGSLTITKAALTITANSVSVPYNQAIPNLTYSATGYLNGDTSYAYTGAPSETTTAGKGSSVGTYPIAITQGSLAATNYSFKFVNGTLTVTSLGTTAAPVFRPVAGTYYAAQTVTVASATSGAIIHYTTNGSTPTTSSPVFPTAGLKVSATQTIKAIAAAPGYSPSAPVMATYIIATAPSVTTIAATAVSTPKATLNATIIANNATTQYWFAYGVSRFVLSSTTTRTGALSGTTLTAVSVTVSGLQPKTTYYFQAIATNGAGTTSGAVLSFTTN